MLRFGGTAAYAAIALIICLLPRTAEAQQSARGYWERQGPITFSFCYEPATQVVTVPADCREAFSPAGGGDVLHKELIDAGYDHATFRVSSKNLGNTATWRATWNVPGSIASGEIIPASVAISATAVSYPHPEWPFMEELPAIQWQGASALTDVIVTSQGYKLGASTILNNRTVRSLAFTPPGPKPGTPGVMRVNAQGLFAVILAIPYVWVNGTPPQTASIPQSAATPPRSTPTTPRQERTAPPVSQGTNGGATTTAVVEDPVNDTQWMVTTAPEGAMTGYWRFYPDGTVQGLVNGNVMWTGKWVRLGHYVYRYTMTNQGVTGTEWVVFSDPKGTGHATQLLGYSTEAMTAPHRAGVIVPRAGQ